MKKKTDILTIFFSKNKGLSLNQRGEKATVLSHPFTYPTFHHPPDEIEPIIANFVQKLYAPYCLNMEPSEYER